MADYDAGRDQAIAALSDTLHTELSTLEADLTSMAGDITQSLAKAVVKGQELDGLLARLVLSQADSALNSALAPVYSMVGSLGEGLVGSMVGGLTNSLSGALGHAPATTAGPATIFNVQVSSPDPASFRNSETQLAASLSRAVARGNRGL